MITSHLENNGSFYLGCCLTRTFRGYLSRLWEQLKSYISSKKKKKSPYTQTMGRQSQHILFFPILFYPSTFAKQSTLQCNSVKGIKAVHKFLTLFAFSRFVGLTFKVWSSSCFQAWWGRGGSVGEETMEVGRRQLAYQCLRLPTYLCEQQLSHDRFYKNTDPLKYIMHVLCYLN